MVEHRTGQTEGIQPPGTAAHLQPTTKIHFQNPQTETAYQGLTGISEGIPPSNEAVLVGIEQAKQSVLSSHNLLDKEGRLIQRDTLILLDLIKMVIEERNSDEKIQNFIICFKNLSQKYAPEFGEDVKFGVKRGYESSQKGTGKDIYNSIIGLRDFVFELIRSSDFRSAMVEFFQYIQLLAGETDETGLMGKLTSGIKSFAQPSTDQPSKQTGFRESSSYQQHPHESEVVSGIGGSPQNIKIESEESLVPSHVHSESELRKNQGELSVPGQYGREGVYSGEQQQVGSGIGQQVGTGIGQQVGSDISQQQPLRQPEWESGRQGEQLRTGTTPLGTERSTGIGQSNIGLEQGRPSEWKDESTQQPLGGNVGEEKLTTGSMFGTSHQGTTPLGTVGSGISDQYREPSEQSNIQGQEYKPTEGIQSQEGIYGQPSTIKQDIPIPPQSQTLSFQKQPLIGSSLPQQKSQFSSGVSSQPSSYLQGEQSKHGQQQPLGAKGYGGLGYEQQQYGQQQPLGTKSFVGDQQGLGLQEQQSQPSKEELEDHLIDRYISLNKRFSKDPNYQRAIVGLFNIFNQARSLFGGEEMASTNRTVERVKQDEDFTSLLNYAKLIMYEFSDRQVFDNWLKTNNDFMTHMRTDEKLKNVFREITNDFKRYSNQPELLEGQQERENLRSRLNNFRIILEEKRNMKLTNDMLASANQLLTTMRNDELNAELRERSQKLISRLFLDEKGNFQFKPGALDQIRTILFVAIQEAISNWNTLEVEGDDGSEYFKISNIVLKANDILPDDVKFKVKNRTSMNYQELKPTDKLSESATLIGAHLFGMTAHLQNVGFLFDRRSFPSISDRGVMDINFDRGGIDIKLKLKARLSQNRPFYVKGIKVGVDTLHIKFKQAEKHKLLLKIFSPIIQSRVRRKIHDNLEQALNVNVRELVERLNDVIENAIIQGNQMAGNQSGGMVSGILGRMGVGTSSTRGDENVLSEDVYQQPSSTSRSRQEISSSPQRSTVLRE